MGITIPPPLSSGRGAPWLEVIGLLKAGIPPDRAASEMNMIAADLSRQFPNRRFGSEVKAVRLEDHVAGSMRPSLLALLGAVSCLLLIACENVATLLLARSEVRRGEWGFAQRWVPEGAD